ncbi:MAG: gamma-glutamyltransferase [Gammaproteobacteria bacterium]|nr:gamma-glutamyltransferase [Gammaproteobacteria bacterium]
MNAKTFSYLTLFSLVIAHAGCGPAQEEQSPESSLINAQSLTSGVAAIAIPDKYAAQISQDILSAGGNAVDAAIAVGFSLAVTFIDAGNIGGGGFMTIKMDDEVAFLDYREKAPMAAHRDMYLDSLKAMLSSIVL